MPWVKFVVDQVKCKVYTKIEGKEKLLAPKLDML
jgi:hypothetical protein